MSRLKELVWPIYRIMKAVFYPLVLLFGLLPGLREHPYRIVGVYTLFLFGFLATRVWTDSVAGAILFIIVQMIGFVFAFGFIVWGQEYEERAKRGQQP